MGNDDPNHLAFNFRQLSSIDITIDTICQLTGISWIPATGDRGRTNIDLTPFSQVMKS
jgi:hypothetical protein